MYPVGFWKENRYPLKHQLTHIQNIYIYLSISSSFAESIWDSGIPWPRSSFWWRWIYDARLENLNIYNGDEDIASHCDTTRGMHGDVRTCLAFKPNGLLRRSSAWCGYTHQEDETLVYRHLLRRKTCTQHLVWWSHHAHHTHTYNIRHEWTFQKMYARDE